MAEQIIARGNAFNIQDIANYEDQFQEGDRGVLDFTCRIRPPQFIVDDLEQTLRASGVTLIGKPQITSGGSYHLLFTFEKRSAFLLIIALAIGAAILLLAIVAAWQLSRIDPAAFMWWLLLVIGVVLVAAVVVVPRLAKAGG